MKNNFLGSRKFFLCLVMSFSILFIFETSFAQSDFWERIFGLNTIYSLAINSDGHIFAGTFGGGVYKSEDNGDSWVQVGASNQVVHCLCITRTGKIYAGTSANGVYYSDDNGDTWDNIGGSWCSPIQELIYKGNTVFAGTVLCGVIKTSNNGLFWDEINNGLPQDAMNCLILNDRSHILVGSLSNGVFLSTDNGDNWSETSLTNKNIQSFAINDEGYIFAGTGGSNGAVYRSMDDGASWDKKDTGLPYNSMQALAINTEGDVFVGTEDHGVYCSTNNGDSWVEINSGLTDDDVRCLAINESGYIFAGTCNKGVFRSVQSTSFVKGRTSRAQISFVLKNNYPNPFNSSTTIEFSIIQSGYVTLKIYDISGKEVALLIRKKFSVGNHKVEWNADNFASGVYYYRLQSDGLIVTKKCVLLK